MNNIIIRVFKNTGESLYNKTVRLEPLAVFISKKQFVFVSLHSEYGSEGGITVFDKKGVEVNDIDTGNWAWQPTETKDGNAVAVLSGNNAYIFDKNAAHVKTIFHLKCFNTGAGADHFLFRGDKKSLNELVLVKVTESVNH